MFNKIKIGDTIGVVGELAMQELTKLSSIVDYNTTNNRLTNNKLHFPSTVRKIGSFAFFQLKLTGSLDIPNSVTEIGRLLLPKQTLAN